MNCRLLAWCCLFTLTAPGLSAQKRKPEPPNPIQREYQDVAGRIIAAPVGPKATAAE